MKRFSVIITLCLLLVTSPALGAYYDFPFIGRWQPAEDPLLIDDYGFQDIQNLRRDGNRLKGVSGHTKINTTALTSTGWTNAYPRNAFHFRKDQPPETHIVTSGGSDTNRSGQTIFDNATAIPDAGDFEATALYTEASGADIPLFSDAPNGNMLACNGEESLIWGGDELRVTSLFTATDTNLANPRDETAAAQNTLQTPDNKIVIGGGNDASTVLLLHVEGAPAGNISDSSAAAHGNATKVDGADITNSYYKFGTGALALDGTLDCILYADHADWDFDSGDFTIDFWYYNSNVGGTYHDGFFGQYTDSNNNFYLDWQMPAGQLRFVSSSAAEGDIAVSVNDPTIDLATKGAFHHIAITREDDDFVIYVNGISVATATDTDDMPNIGGSFGIGISALDAGTDYYTTGKIDEFRISKGVARWTSNFTPPDRSYQTARPFMMIGSTRPIQGLKMYVTTPNIVTSGSSLLEWTGSAWDSLDITDNTISGGVALAQTGTITFDSTVDSSVPRFFEGEYNYWYKYWCTAGMAEIYSVTVDAAMQDVVDLWDGVGIVPIQFQVYDGGIWEDYTEEVLEEGLEDFESNPIAGELDDLANTEYVYVGFPSRISGIKWNMLAEHENDAATTVAVYYWSGGAWVSVGTVTDGTKFGTDSLARNGWMYWNPPGAGEEFPRNLFGARTGAIPFGRNLMESLPDLGSGLPSVYFSDAKANRDSSEHVRGFPSASLYYYKFMWDVALGTDVLVDTVIGGGNVDTIDGYKFPLLFQGRSFLCSETGREKNKCIYSMFNAPDVWNGSDTGRLLFGADTELTAGAVIYNVYRTAGFEQVIICKQNETYRVFGDGPGNWNVDQISANVGCVAPQSMTVCDVADISPDTKRHVAIWQAGHGVVMCDGATIVTISDDIKNYWDRNSDDYIPADRQDDSVGSYNPNLETYKLLISSGTGQTTHNVEVEYSLKYQDWTKLYRENATGANPLQTIFQVHSTTGTTYAYGTTDEGYMYRLENGNSWDNTVIAHRLWTKNLIIDNERPYWKSSVVEYIRLAFEDKNGSVAEIAIAHYCDDALTVDGTDDQDTWDAINFDEGPYDTQDVTLGPCLTHSFLITAGASDVPDGPEYNALGFVFDSFDTIME